MEQITTPTDLELLSRSMQIEHKLFYLDLKENTRGRYLKISERTANTRSTIIVPGNAVVCFVELFNYYLDKAETQLVSKELRLETKTFYFDVGDNPRGRYLQVSEKSGSGSRRSMIIVPAGVHIDGWEAIRDLLDEIHKATERLPPPAAALMAPAPHPGPPRGQAEILPGAAGPQLGAPYPVAPYPTVPGQSQQDGVIGGTRDPESQAAATTLTLRVDQKKFFFDFGRNPRGEYLKISEVTGVDRSSIIVPASGIEGFHMALGNFVDLIRNQGGPVPATTANIRTIAPRRRPDQ